MEEALKLLLGQAGVQLLTPSQTGGAMLAAVPDGWRIEDLEEFGAVPKRIRQKPVVRGVAAFVNYVNRFKRVGSTIFVVPDLKSLGHGSTLATCIIDYHDIDRVENSPQSDRPAWGDHVVTLKASPSLAYEKLMNLDGKLLDQDVFARHLEEISRFCSSHDQAQIVEIARSIALTSKGNFKIVDDVFSGSVDFVYDVKVSASAGTSEKKLTVPNIIGFEVPLLDGLDTFAVPVKFKYRQPDEVGGKVKLGIEIQDRLWLEEAALVQVRAKLEADTGLDVYVGGI